MKTDLEIKVDHFGLVYNSCVYLWFNRCLKLIRIRSHICYSLISIYAGLRYLVEMTADSDQSLRVDMTDWENTSKYAEYKSFKVGPSSEKYKLTVTDYKGTAGKLHS